MQLTLDINIPALPKRITYIDQLFLIGSCFSENMYEKLAHHKFQVLSNPHGILFNPLSVTQSLDSYIDGKTYTAGDLFLLNELWNSWDHHTRFSDVSQEEALRKINTSQAEAAKAIRKTNYLIITLGSAFQYYLKESGRHVANNHRAPGQWFEKRLLPIKEITEALSNTLQKLIVVNPNVQIIFTISPVRHIRDGVIDNNRSKARLLEAVHELCELFPQANYFPAYELIIDILRDYRFYDIDFVHPNYLATNFVWEHFVKSCISDDTKDLMKQVLDIMTARNHKTRFPQTEAHKTFLSNYTAKVSSLLKQYPYLNLQDELAYFQKKD
ncbi:GSCFA domain-containing protein [Taibaiella soli]|uniref:GSCFA domain-containing protein n=1 Tax=Taibaiella soli TaxID=1649169 RepID=A0A2W2AYQ5_9BACT|nr:GSCFA domain-containing protein [Taibaiella soli]PZF72788.1 GSCFA domain-containing protein [Taibaiella soli]